jgi:hypothetical protein
MSGKGAKGLSGKGAKGTMAKGDKKKPISRSIKAGLQFPVGRIHRFLKARPHAAAQRTCVPPRPPLRAAARGTGCPELPRGFQTLLGRA